MEVEEEDKTIEIYNRKLLEIFIRIVDESEKQFYSSKCHKYPPGSLLICMGASACGQQ